MLVSIHTPKVVNDQKADWVTSSNNTSLQLQKLLNIDFRSPQLKRISIETALMTSPTNHLHEKKTSRKRKYRLKAKWIWVEHILLIFNAIWKRPAIPRILPGLLTSSNKMPFSMKTNRWQNYIMSNFPIYPLKTWLSNVTKFIKDYIQSQKIGIEHWVRNKKLGKKQEMAWMKSWPNNCICHEKR